MPPLLRNVFPVGTLIPPSISMNRAGRTLAEDYPYFAPACRIRTDSDTPEYGRILELLAGPALDREARDAWTRAGLPREKSAVTL